MATSDKALDFSRSATLLEASRPLDFSQGATLLKDESGLLDFSGGATPIEFSPADTLVDAEPVIDRFMPKTSGKSRTNEEKNKSDRGWTGTLADLGSSIWDAAVYHTPAAVAAAMEGDDPFAERDWKDKLIQRARTRAEERRFQSPSIQALGPSLGFSLTSALAGIGTGVPTGIAASAVGTPAAGTFAGYGAGTAASGRTAYRMATNQFVRDLHEVVNAEHKERTGRDMTANEFRAKQQELADVINHYGLWEAIPEALANVMGFGILKLPVKSAIGRIFGKHVATRVATKLGALYGEELATETLTQMGQQRAEAAAGVTPEDPRSFTSGTDWVDSFREIAGPVLLQTTIMAGGAAGGIRAYDALTGSRDVSDEAAEAGPEEEPETKTAAQVTAFADERIAELEAQGYLRPQEKEELAALQENRDNPRVIAEAYDVRIEPTGERERVRTDTPPPSQEDIESPIPTDLIQEGREVLQDAIGQQSAAQILEAAGFPPIDSQVQVSGRNATVVDAYEQDGNRGAKLQYEDGRVVAESFETLRGRVSPMELEGAEEIQRQETQDAIEAEARRAAEQPREVLTPALDTEGVTPVEPELPARQSAIDDGEPVIDRFMPKTSGNSRTNREKNKFRDLEDRAVRVAALRKLAEQAGWAEVGGRIIRKTNDPSSPDYNEIVGRTHWLPRADWWPGRPGAYNVEQTERIIEKGINGKLLGKNQREYFEFLTKIADEMVVLTEYQPTDQELIDVGLKQSADAEFEVALVARAIEIDEDAVEQAAKQFEDDDVGFLRSVKAIADQATAVDEGRKDRTQAEDSAELTLAPTAAPPPTEPQATRGPEPDLLGEDVRAQQALADEQRRRDQARQTGQESVETGRADDLFSQARQQTDIEALATSPERALAAARKVENKPLYANRPVTNAADIIAWAREQGFQTTLTADEMHVTIAYSKEAVDTTLVGETPTEVTSPGGDRVVEQLGDDGAVVLRFSSAELQKRWREYREAGASWDYQGYKPHVTITYKAGDVDLSKVQPYQGPIVLGSEAQEELREDATDDLKEVPTAAEEQQQAVSETEPRSLAQRDEPIEEEVGQTTAGYRYEIDEAGMREIAGLTGPVAVQAQRAIDHLEAGDVPQAFKTIRVAQSLAEGIAKKKITAILRDSWYERGGVVERFAIDESTQDAVLDETDRLQARMRFSGEWNEKRSEVAADLRRALDEIGLRRVALRLPDNMDIIDGRQEHVGFISGRYVPGLIDISLSPERDYGRTLHHEAIHALRDLGVFRDSEWRTLERAAKADTDAMNDVRERYAAQDLTDEQLVEERIADMYGEWHAGQSKVRGFIRTAFERIRNFLDALGNALRGNGFQTAADVFESIERGEVGARPEQPSEVAAEPRYALRPDDFDPTVDDSAQTRQKTVNRWYGAQPLDMAFRLPWHIFGGINERGEWKWGVRLSERTADLIQKATFTETGRFAWLNPLLQKARAGLIDRYGLEPAYIERERQRGLDERRITAQVPEIMERLRESNIGPAEAKVLQAVLTGEAVPDEEISKLAEPIRNAIDDMGAEAVELGLISAESFERNRGAYLHRVYLKHEGDQGAIGRWVSRMASQRRRKIIGSQFKGRGLWIEVAPGRVMRNVPGFKKAERGNAVQGERFLVLDLVKQEASDTLRGIDPTSQHRVLDRVYIPDGASVPSQFSGYQDRGVWEVRGRKGSNLVLWRDFAKHEREQMGEIVDARYTIAKTYMQMAHDLATGRFFKDIALNEDWARKTEPRAGTWKNAEEYNRFLADPEIEWVRAPETVIANSRTKRYGQLAGSYVRAEIWRDLAELEQIQRPNLWTKLLTQWKVNKTGRSPVVHMNNVMSNVVLMDLADVRVVDLARGIRSMLRMDKDYQGAVDNGTFGADMISQEIRRNTLQPLLEEIEHEIQGGQDTMEARIGFVGKLADTIWSRIKGLDRGMVNLYRLEDEVFRMATYIRNLDRGMAPSEAALDARDQFLNYDIRAPWVNAARRSVLPFISYSYRAVPVIARSVALRPWKLAKYITIAYVVNALGYMFESGDEEEERGSLRDTEQGGTWIGAPRMIRMPFSDSYGNPVFLDIRRWIPAGDVFDMNQGHGAFPIPAPLQFGGPMMLAAELALNKQAFTGKEITNDHTDDWWDRSSKIADWAWKSWMPSAAWIPGSWYWERISNAITGARDYEGRPYELAQAIPSSVGVKLKPQDVTEAFFWKGVEFDRIERELQAALRSIGRDYDRGLISRTTYERREQRILKKFANLELEYERTFTDQ